MLLDYCVAVFVAVTVCAAVVVMIMLKATVAVAVAVTDTIRYNTFLVAEAVAAYVLFPFRIVLRL